MTAARAFAPLSLADLFALQIPKLEWVVEDLIPLGSLNSLVAREKSGKSLMLTDLACSIALGEPFLDRAVTQGPAILIPAEENIRDVRARIEIRLAGRRDCPLYVLPVGGYTEDRLQLADADSMGRLSTMVEDLAPVLVGIDPLRELHTLAENDSDAMAPLLRPLRQIAHDANTAIVVVHHASRSGASRGSTAIPGSVDQEILFTRTDEESETMDRAQGSLRVLGRFGPRQRFAVRLGDGLRWELGTPVLSIDDSSRGRILACLRDATDWLDYAQIAELAKVHTKTVQNLTSKMLREAAAPIAARGTGTKNDARRFRIVNPALELGDDSRASHASYGSNGSDPIMIPGSHSLKGAGMGGNHSEATGDVASRSVPF